jgi:hypothetical protein
LTDGLGGAAIVVGAISLYFTLSGGKSDPSKQGARAATKTASAPPAPELRLGVGPDRVFLQGEF